MKINSQTLRETKRNLAIPKIARECNLYKKEGNVNNCDNSPSKLASNNLKQKPLISR
jgi:hypothetical protein